MNHQSSWTVSYNLNHILNTLVWLGKVSLYTEQQKGFAEGVQGIFGEILLWVT